MPKPIPAIDYLARADKCPTGGVAVLFGDEAFLKRLALIRLKEQVLAGDDAEFSVTQFDGGATAMRDVLDALSTRPLFGGGRHLVIVEDADGFVSQNRAALEDYVAGPTGGSVLVLDVKQWLGTTRLAKALCESGLQVECKLPPPARLLAWLCEWSKRRHQATLEPDAAELLVDTVESDIGLLDGELAKLAAAAGPDGTITAEMVRGSVGGWRAQTAWEMLEAALRGETSTALVQLDRLLLSGEAPIAILAQISSNLRRFAAATRLIEQAEHARRRIKLGDALATAGVKPFLLGKAQEQLRRLGRKRAGRLYGWLLEADLALKGTSSSPHRARWVLEQLIVRISSGTGTVMAPRRGVGPAAP